MTTHLLLDKSALNYTSHGSKMVKSLVSLNHTVFKMYIYNENTFVRAVDP